MDMSVKEGIASSRPKKTMFGEAPVREATEELCARATKCMCSGHAVLNCDNLLVSWSTS